MVAAAGPVCQGLQNITIKCGGDDSPCLVSQKTAVAGSDWCTLFSSNAHDQQLVVRFLQTIGKTLFLRKAIDAVSHQENAASGGLHFIQQANRKLDRSDRI